jgi:Protein of unknown function (DUF2946)
MRTRSVMTHRLLYWTMLLVVWFGAVAPTLAHAMRHQGLLVGDDICSVRAVARTAAAGGEEKDDGSTGSMGADCPFCLLQAHTPVLPSSVCVAPSPSADLQHALPALFLQAPYTLHAWRHRPPRGPPGRV